jgi:hypothetical protein
MLKSKVSTIVLSSLLATTGLAYAQEQNPTAGGQSPMQSNAVPMSQDGMRDNVPLYKIQVVGRDIPAINYFHRSSATKIGFQGTSLLPQAKGYAKVEAHLGRTSIDANFEGLTPANGFGNEYLTYVLWAITPKAGRSIWARFCRLVPKTRIRLRLRQICKPSA